MSKIALLPSNPTLVNYTNVLTSVSNEIYIPKTESPESLASLMKDTITFEFSFIPVENVEGKKPAEENSFSF